MFSSLDQYSEYWSWIQNNLCLFTGWQWTQQWATLLHRTLLAWHPRPPCPWPHQWSPDPGAEVRSWVHARSLSCGAGHRPGSGSFAAALGFGHCPSVCDRWKWQCSCLQLSVCGQRNGGSACRVGGKSHSRLVCFWHLHMHFRQLASIRPQRKNFQEAC